MQAVKWRIVRRQHEGVIWQHLEKMLQRSEPLLKRIAFWLGARDTDIGCNSRDHLIPRDQNIESAAVQAGMFR